jgi:DNA-binding transcriptional MerR regulator
MYKIGEFADITNITIKTLRYYDEIGLIKPSYIDYYTNYRYYSNDQVNDVKVVLELKDLGLSLNEIKMFIDTKDINILKNKEKELLNIVENIKDYINDKKDIEFIVGDYEKFVYWNGNKEAGSPFALEIKDNNCDYFTVKVNGEYFDDIYVFIHEDNLINLNICLRPFNEYFDETINFLKTKYDHVTLKYDKDRYGSKIYDEIKNKCNVIKEDEDVINLPDGRVFKLSLLTIDLKEDK